MERYDLVVIGSGPGGEKAAAQAAYFGKRVVVVERAPEPGGAAVHTGTLPSKTLRETAVYLSGHRSRALYGLSLQLEKDVTLQTLMARKRAIAVAESRRIRENLGRHDVPLMRGHGRLLDAHTVEVTANDGTKTVLSTDFVLLATGSVPRRPREIDFTSPRVHDSDEVLLLDELPTSMVVLGAGVIGCEYACMFAALGVEVTLVDGRAEILPFLDPELSERLRDEMQNLGIRLELGGGWSTELGGIVADESEVRCLLSDGRTLRAAHLLFAAGRSGATRDLGLENVGLEPDRRGNLTVDAGYATSVPSVLAVGDVIGFPALASASMEQGRVAVCRAFGFGYKEALSGIIPYGIYTIPEVSAVGETERTMQEKGEPYVVGRARFHDNARGQIQGDLGGLTKLVVCAKTRKVLGVHVIGERASELVHLGQVALLAGATVDLFIEMVFNYPTLSETYKYAAYECLGALAKG
ncbi:MAG: Si-specific NAD(P)(+) transhydrogenase [Sandaracinus sp.]|nr:Si-specific NAD(P)(+) transhydrogenase [Sandaracinus sp.]